MAAVRSTVAAALLAMICAALPARAETIDGTRIIIIDGDTVALPCAVPTTGCAGERKLPRAPERFNLGTDCRRLTGGGEGCDRLC
jgi:hypothetical protein